MAYDKISRTSTAFPQRAPLTTAFTTALCALFVTTLSGCGFLDSGTRVKMKAGGGQGESGIVNAQSDGATNFTRSSGDVTYLRLDTLFPGASSGELSVTQRGYVSSTATLKRFEFDWLFSGGLAQSLAQTTRPTSPLALVALRKYAESLCEKHLEIDGKTAGSLFSELGGSLGDLKSPPTEPALRYAVLAARNAFLGNFEIDSPEVLTLAKLYRDVLAQPGSSATEAARAVCVGTILAPQFWVGHHRKSEPIRRVALELGGRTPTFSELREADEGKLTAPRFLKRLQDEAKEQYAAYAKDPSDPEHPLPPYYRALRLWLRDFLGMRPWQEGYALFEQYTSIPRDPASALSSAFNPTAGHAIFTVGDPSPELGGVYAAFPGGHYSEGSIPRMDRCSPVPGSGQWIQPFDPRTVEVLWEQHDPERNRWEVAGAWVHPGYLPLYRAQLAYLGSAQPSLADLLDPTKEWCALDTEPEVVTDSPGREKEPRYYACRGRVSSADRSRYIATDLQDLTWPESNGTRFIDAAGSRMRETQAGNGFAMKRNGASLTDLQSDGGRRVTRFAPTGPQTGMSQVAAGYSRTPVYVCNGLQRILASCVFRPTSQSAGSTDWGRYGWNADQLNARKHLSRFGADLDPMSFHPWTLNKFRCGSPDERQIETGSNYSDEKAYPRGYDLTDYAGLRVTLDGSGNPVWPTIDSNVSAALEKSGRYLSYRGSHWHSRAAPPAEMESLSRLREDIDREPFYLLEHALQNDLPFDSILTSDFTIVRGDLEEFYRRQGLMLPLDPPGFTPPAPREKVALRKLRFPDVPAIPAPWLRSTVNLMKVTGAGNAANSPDSQREYFYNATWMASDTDISAAGLRAGALPAKTSSGVLTMPVFLNPVMAVGGAFKMRSLASRIFTRLLGIDPSGYQPTDGQKNLHRKYMVGKDSAGNEVGSVRNSSAAAHLDEARGCFSCHVNLDPLGAALSPRFLERVDHRDETPYAALQNQGEMVTLTEPQAQPYYGFRGGSEKGTGALLGQEVSGVRDVGRVLASSPQWATNVVTKAFQLAFGRPPRSEDVDLIQELSEKYRSHRSLNRLLVDLVSARSFNADN